MRFGYEVFSLALITIFGLALPTLAQTIELEINNTPSDSDDYIGWTPVRAQIRQLGGAADLTISLESTQRTAGQHNGEVHFAPYSATVPTPASFNPVPTLNITLPANATWKGFWVAGKEHSADGKDVSLRVKNSAGTILKEHSLMVRVRKNAESLSDVERDRFLEALANLHDLNNAAGVGKNSKYLKYVKAHDEAFGFGIHGTPGFTQWHRAMLLSFERELQAIDPRVALPYWEFHKTAPKLFTRKFAGVITTTSSQVQFDSTNPIRKWAMPSTTEIAAITNLSILPVSNEKMVRANNASSITPDVDFDSVLAEDSHTLMRAQLEGNYHNEAHNFISGWLATGSSPRDPLFFFLHANVDRAWAKWQREKGRFDPTATDSLSYSPLGNYPGQTTPNRFHAGVYAKDTLWPWNGSGGTQGNTDPRDDWPNYSFSMPAPYANHGPDGRVHNLIDYLDTHGNGKSHGVCYDDVMFK